MRNLSPGQSMRLLLVGIRSTSLFLFTSTLSPSLFLSLFLSLSLFLGVYRVCCFMECEQDRRESADNDHKSQSGQCLRCMCWCSHALPSLIDRKPAMTPTQQVYSVGWLIWHGKRWFTIEFLVDGRQEHVLHVYTTLNPSVSWDS